MQLSVNKRVAKLAAAGILAASLAAACLQAGEPTEPDKEAHDPYMRVAMARTYAEIAIRDAGPSFSATKNGYDAAGRAIEAARNMLIEKVSEARDAEMAKQDGGDLKFIDNCNVILNETDKRWDVFGRKDGAEISARYDEVVAQFERLTALYEKLAGVEEEWKAAGVELAPLESAYASIEREVARSTRLVGEIVETLGAARAGWETHAGAALVAIQRPAATNDGAAVATDGQAR